LVTLLVSLAPAACGRFERREPASFEVTGRFPHDPTAYTQGLVWADSPQRVVHVRYKGDPVYKLNELEYVNGDVFANVYQSNWVLRIDPVTGNVRELLDFADLYPERPASAEFMNGIALAPDDGQLLLRASCGPFCLKFDFARPSRITDGHHCTMQATGRSSLPGSCCPSNSRRDSSTRRSR
jgi:glutamine cyclotransferase